MRGFVLGVIVTLLALAAGGLLVASQGLFPVGADNPPSALERRMAHMAVDAYVESHAPKQQNPIPLNAATLADGARLYERHCAACHGGAASRVSPLRAKFSPPVPQLIAHVPGDPDPDFFWVVKHGIRMTGMPGWDGILTDDQIWTVVHFIKNSDKLPPEAEAAWKEAAGVK